MKKLFLHIGFNKTGSTSLQKNLALNSGRLLQQGILYPNAPKEPFMQHWQHVPLAAAVPGRQVHWLNQKKRKTLDQAYSSLFDSLEGQDYEALLISSESFGALDMQLEKIKWLQERFAGFDVTVVAYIRRQDSYFLSTYQEGIKAGQHQPFSFDGHMEARGLYFARRLAPWREVFGAGNVIVRPFAPNLWPEGELFYDFLDTLGAGRSGMELAEPENEGLDHRAVELLRQLNQLNAKVKDRAETRRRHQKHLAMIKSFDQLLPPKFEKKKMQLSSEQAETLRSWFQAENEAALAGSGISADEFFPPVQGGREARLLPERLNPHLLLNIIAGLAVNTDSKE